jgi:hypothetical protein
MVFSSISTLAFHVLHYLQFCLLQQEAYLPPFELQYFTTCHVMCMPCTFTFYSELEKKIHILLKKSILPHNNHQYTGHLGLKGTKKKVQNPDMNEIRHFCSLRHLLCNMPQVNMNCGMNSQPRKCNKRDTDMLVSCEQQFRLTHFGENILFVHHFMQTWIKAGLFLCNFFLHNFTLIWFENLHHFVNLHNNVQFNVTGHTQHPIIFSLTRCSIHDLWSLLSCTGC